MQTTKICLAQAFRFDEKRKERVFRSNSLVLGLDNNSAQFKRHFETATGRLADMGGSTLREIDSAISGKNLRKYSPMKLQQKYIDMASTPLAEKVLTQAQKSDALINIPKALTDLSKRLLELAAGQKK